MTPSQKARVAVFKSRKFRADAFERLNHPSARSSRCLDALLDAGRIPHDGDDNTAALAMDAAYMLIAIGSQQEKTSTIIRTTDRLASLKGVVEGETPSVSFSANGHFAADVAAVIEGFWRDMDEGGLRPMAVSVLWGDKHGHALFGAISRWPERTNRAYADKIIKLEPGQSGYDHVRLAAVGGSVFGPLPMLGFAELLAESVEESTAAPDLKQRCK